MRAGTDLGVLLFKKKIREIAYASRTLTQTERNYAQIENECLTSVWACERFDRYIAGLDQFRLLRDHKPLVPLINNTHLRCQTLLMRLRRYNPVAEYIPWKLLLVSDALSRNPMQQTHNTIEEDVEVYPIYQPLCSGRIWHKVNF